MRKEFSIVEFSLLLGFAARITWPKIDEIQALSHLPGCSTKTSRAPYPQLAIGVQAPAAYAAVGK
jgi:hypothetical protein